jgi:hypothetical protein
MDLIDPNPYIPLLIPAAAAVAARPLSELLPPRTATWLLTLSSLALAAVSTVMLGVLALGGAIRIPQVAALGHISLPAIRHSEDTSLPVAAVAGLALLAGTCSLLYATYRQVRALRAAARAARELPAEDGLAILQDDSPEAFALPGRPGRVVVSTGMLAALSPAEREALLAHERAHLHGRHHLFRSAVALAAAANPLLRPVRAAIVYSTERWADERAALAVADRTVAARAVGKAALAARQQAGSRAVAALGVAGPGPVPRRVAALLDPRPRRHRLGLLTATVATVLVIASITTTQEEAGDLDRLVDCAQAQHAWCASH